MEKIIIGNWKLHGSKELIQEYFTKISQQPSPKKSNLIIAPPYLYLPIAQQIVSGSHINLAAQNCSDQEIGAFTGEISAIMLKDLAIKFVIIGHSERRIYYGETSSLIANKVRLAHTHGLTPILCIMDPTEKPEMSKTLPFLQSQLQELQHLYSDIFTNTLLAYEPKRAIGTGISEQPDFVSEVAYRLKQLLAGLKNNVKILYGGSINTKNVRSFLTEPNIDGILVGAASLDWQNFVSIYNSIEVI